MQKRLFLLSVLHTADLGYFSLRSINLFFHSRMMWHKDLPMNRTFAAHIYIYIYVSQRSITRDISEKLSDSGSKQKCFYVRRNSYVSKRILTRLIIQTSFILAIKAWWVLRWKSARLRNSNKIQNIGNMLWILNCIVPIFLVSRWVKYLHLARE